MKAFKFIKAAQFFPKYCPGIVDYKRKLSGRNSRGNKLNFSAEEVRIIKAGIKKMLTDLT
jgi:hypothetical protein